MKKVIVLSILGLFAWSALAADKLTLQLKWVTQAQFAGYYVAKDKGYYSAEGLDVTIKPGGPDIATPQVLAGGGADVIIEWIGSALATREKGVPLVNIAQTFKRAGLMLTCRKDSGIRSPSDFAGKKIGVWFGGNEYPLLSWLSKLGISASGGSNGVTLIKQGWNVDPLLQKQAHCVSTMSYNEYWQVIDAGLSPADLVVFKYDGEGVAVLEDGLYVMENRLNDANFVNRLARFLRASMKGWEYAGNNPDEAADIVLENDDTGAQTEKHQRRMMREINKLVANADQPNGIGYLDPSDFNRSVGVLLASGDEV
ncbi:MAG: ABC transporter substrate-binding protein, partial [SAR324 cluster bacterium]|nr:ABC transporter substrate-binding protein [SAR324 cluster bacterium]